MDGNHVFENCNIKRSREFERISFLKNSILPTGLMLLPFPPSTLFYVEEVKKL